jgi:hypothetical protein
MAGRFEIYLCGVGCSVLRQRTGLREGVTAFFEKR